LNLLIVRARPEPASFNGAPLTRAALAALRETGRRTRDLAMVNAPSTASCEAAMLSR
jgi:hypothetical protein